MSKALTSFTFQIANLYGPSREVKGWKLNSVFALSRNEWGRKFQITHVPTGYAVAFSVSRQEAVKLSRALMRKFGAKVWAFTNPKKTPKVLKVGAKAEISRVLNREWD